jgi:hypothetical protein
MSFDALSYFENVAKKHVQILHTDSEKHFFRTRSLATLDELLNDLSTANFPALMVHDTIDGMLGDFGQSDSYIDEPQFIFYVLQRVDFGDHVAVDDAIQQCRQIGKSILARMLRHKVRGEHGLDFLDMSRISYQSVGPIHDNVYGMMYMMSVADDAGLLYNAEDWDGNW